MRLGGRGGRRVGELVGCVGLVVVGGAPSAAAAVELGPWPGAVAAELGGVVAELGARVLELPGRDASTMASAIAPATMAPPAAARARRERRGVACVP